MFLVLTVLTIPSARGRATQVNGKRMLAYSSIAHTGYIMPACGGGPHQRRDVAAQARSSCLPVGYALMNIAAFAVVGMPQRDTRPLRRP